MERNEQRAVARGEPGWIFLFAGWLWATVQLAAPARHFAREAERSARSDAWTSSAGSPSAAPREARLATDDSRPREIADLEHMSLRELRRLPGVGQARALAIARARWDATAMRDPAVFPRVPGIGPATVARIHRWFGKSR